MANWFDPDTLSETEREAAEASLGVLGKRGDFGSYAEVNRTGRLPVSLGGHNLIRVTERVAVYRKLLKRNFTTICDLGCGVGLTTRELARHFPNARVTGFEISREAVAYADRNIPEAAFERRVLSSDTDLGMKFDLVLAQEFYPFTRTGDFDVHSAWLKMLIRHTVPDGLALIVLSERDASKSILANIEAATALCRAEGRRLSRQRLPFDRVYHHLPILWASRFGSAVLARAGYDRIVALSID